MKILLINGSPKTKQSASTALLADCKACFSRETEWRERHAARPVFSPEDAAALSWADSVVFAFPPMWMVFPRIFSPGCARLSGRGVYDRRRGYMG